MIERQPPRGAHQPRAKAVAVSQLRKVAMAAHQRLLRDVFGVFPVPQD
jgi:hypothetical protein